MGPVKAILVLVLSYYLLGRTWTIIIAAFIVGVALLHYLDNALRKAKYEKLKHEGLKILKEAQEKENNKS